MKLIAFLLLCARNVASFSFNSLKIANDSQTLFSLGDNGGKCIQIIGRQSIHFISQTKLNQLCHTNNCNIYYYPNLTCTQSFFDYKNYFSFNNKMGIGEINNHLSEVKIRAAENNLFIAQKSNLLFMPLTWIRNLLS